MLHSYRFKWKSSAFRVHWAFTKQYKAYSSRSDPNIEAADIDVAREWAGKFSQSTIPMKIARTKFSRSSGPGGQKTNKTSSKATTTWNLDALRSYVPKVLHDALRSSRYYVSSSNSIQIHCDSHRSQIENEQETHKRLYQEISLIYKEKVPGITTPEQKEKIEQLKKIENAARLKMKKIHGDKKRARGGGGRVGDF